MIVDLCFFIATLIFSLMVLDQIYKNYKIKKITSQSMLWHFGTFIGLFFVLYGHFHGGYWLSVIITVFNIIERVILIFQIKKYWIDLTPNVKMDKRWA